MEQWRPNDFCQAGLKLRVREEKMTRYNSLLINRRRFLKTASFAAMAAGVTTATTGRVQAQPAKPGELLVRAWGGNWVDSLDKGVSKPFTEATGIKVSYDTTYHEEMKPKIWQAIAQNRRPPVHVNWDISATAIESARRGVCVDLADLDQLPEMNEIARPTGVEGVPYIAMYSYVYILAYSGKAFPDNPPDSWNVLLDPKFRGRVAILDTGDGIIQVAPIAAGGSASDIPANMEKGWEWIAKLKANEPLLGKDPDMTKWFQQGEVDLGCTIVTNLMPVKNTGVDVRWTVPKESAYVATDCMWVPTGFNEDETYWAKQYVNFAMTPQAQETWCYALGLPGTRKGFKPPAEFANDPSYPTEAADFEKLLQMADEVKATNWKDWQLKYKEIMNI
jgi:putative spermidine/putrescine transport system substrate-binding protein